MVLACTQRGDYVRRRGRVAQPDREVPQPALVADAADARAAHALVEFALRPRGALHQRGTIQAVADRKISFFRNARKAVPGTDELAVVAAVHAVADER